MQDVASPVSYKFNCEKSISIWTKFGRSKVTVSDHMKLVRTFRPNVFECLYDSAPSSENKMKRVGKEGEGGRRRGRGWKREEGEEGGEKKVIHCSLSNRFVNL